MSYAPYRPPQRPVRRGGIVPNPSRRNTAGLGFVAAAAAVAQNKTVQSIVKDAASAIIGIFDPGKKRDKNREARAEMWYQLALAGSITAARRLYGGQTIQYTDKEKQMYKDRWAKFAQANPTLAQQAVQKGGLGIPEPGSDVVPPSLSSTEQEKLRQEIALYTGGSSESLPGDMSADVPPADANAGAPPAAHPPIQEAGLSSNPLVLGAAAAALLLAFTKRRR